MIWLSSSGAGPFACVLSQSPTLDLKAFGDKDVQDPVQGNKMSQCVSGFCSNELYIGTRPIILQLSEGGDRKYTPLRPPLRGFLQPLASAQALDSIEITTYVSLPGQETQTHNHKPACGVKASELPSLPNIKTQAPKPEKKPPRKHKVPLTASEALKFFKNQLSSYEQSEVLGYPELWFLGLDTEKLRVAPEKLNKTSFDDEHGSYMKVLHDHIAYHYEVLEMIGKGSFGQVAKCLDHKNDELVALKIIRNKKRFHHQALVELKILETLRRKDKDNSYHVVHMKDFFYFCTHLCITFELLGINLYELMRNNSFQGFSLSIVRRFTLSVLKCLQMLYVQKIIHSDLKPVIYTFIQNHFYRSPELILGHPYKMAIDTWGLGCIMAELYTGTPCSLGRMKWSSWPASWRVREAEEQKGRVVHGYGWGPSGKEGFALGYVIS
ncbi:hypothetical protein MC885_011087 [Smutsia gigantea]|nr:hypothetical protein MC885_011087 [Smutsia gigantea]